MQLYDTTEKKQKLVLISICLNNESEIVNSLNELEELINTLNYEQAARLIQNRDRADNSTYFGKGKLEELRCLIEETNAQGIVCDDELTKVQIRNLESILNVNILDRTMIILDIFAKRASTSEGKIQVELAMLKYNATRLIGSRTYLSRLGGGIGSKGLGEKKLELDRRLIHERISSLKEELKQVKRHRENTRKSRLAKNKFNIAIVGYTNAGKSSLLNLLTNSDILAKDKLFATLDPTTRKFILDNGQEVLITDTVGFIRKLPTDIIEAFRATLEEAKYADLILHVVDSANNDMENHMLVVYDTLKKLNILNKDILTVYNKIDKIDELEKKEFPRDFHAVDNIKISVKTGFGIEQLKEKIATIIRNRKIYFEKLYSYLDLSKLQDIRKYGELISEEYTTQGVEIKAYIPCELYKKVTE